MSIVHHKTIPPFEPAIWNGDKVEPPKEGRARWGGKLSVPAIDTVVHCTVNKIGACKVLSYFTEEGWLGFMAMPQDPPDWYVKQNGRDTPCHLFGTEFREVA